MSNNLSWGARVAHERRLLGIDQEVLAKAIGTDQPTISKIERGVLKLSVERSVAIASALGVTIDRLLHGRIPALDSADQAA